MQSLQDLPHEVLLNIFQHVGAEELAALSMTCRNFTEAICEPKLWKDVTYKDYLYKANIYPPNFIKFTHKIAEKYKWNTVYRLLMINKKEQFPFFWDDIEEIEKFKKDKFTLEKAPVSVIVFLLMKKLDATDMDEHLTFEREHWCELAIVLSSSPTISLYQLIRYLLDCAIGPYNTTIKNTDCKLSCVNIKKFDELLYEHGERKHYFAAFPPKSLFEESNNFIDELQPLNERMSKALFFDMTPLKVEQTALNIIFKILNHCNIFQDEFILIADLVQRKILRHKFQAVSMQGRILHLVKKGWYVNKKKRIHYKKYLSRFEFLDRNLTVEMMALKLTHREQAKLASKMLNEYLDNLQSRNRSPSRYNERKPYYNYLYSKNEEPGEPGRTLLIEELQSENLASYIVNMFSTISNIENHTCRVFMVTKFIDVSALLYKMNNFKSFKDLMEAVRGILTFQQKTGLSWKDIEYQALRKFVDLENLLDKEDNHKTYRDRINNLTQHCIPIMRIHAEELEEIEKAGIDIEREKQLEKKYKTKGNLQEHCNYLYFNLMKNDESAAFMSKLYHYFNRR